MTLAKMKSGSKATIVSTATSRVLGERLAALGLFPGAEIEVIRSSRGGEMILGAFDSRIALGRELTEAIRVA